MKTTVKEIYKGFSNSALRLPYTLVYYQCGHAVEMEFRDVCGDRHSPENWLVKEGDPADCAKCDRNSEAIKAILAFVKTPEYSHTTLRDVTASMTGKWMSFYVYQHDPSSPTQCRLALSVEARPDTEQALREAGITFVHGPSRGRLAMR